MSAKSMYDVKEMLCAELDQYARKGGISRSDLEPIEQLTTSIKNITKITEMEESGYSYGEGNWRANGSYSNGMNPMMYDSRYSGRGRSSRDGAAPMRNEYSGENYDMNNMESRMRREVNY